MNITEITDEIRNRSDIDDFIKTAKLPDLRFNRKRILIDSDEVHWFNRGAVIIMGWTHSSSLTSRMKQVGKNTYREQLIHGIVVDSQYFANADYNDDEIGCPLFSFNCLANLLFPEGELPHGYKPVRKIRKNDARMYKLCEELYLKKVVLLDYTPDEIIPLTVEEKKLVRSYWQAKPENRHKYRLPSRMSEGLTLEMSSATNAKWHKVGACLFRDTVTDARFLLARDEGTYFGCHLAGKPTTIAEAYLDLIPSEARNKNYTRQGEWFAVPAEWPSLDEIAFTSENGGCLPLETSNSNSHEVVGRIAVTKSGQIFLHNNASINHDQHETLQVSSPALLVRNTALRSVSQEGVD